MKKVLIKVSSFCLILICILWYACRILSFKYVDGIYGMQKFYELDKNSVDVLVLGSSHAFEDINTGVLWDEYGIASYDLCGSVQPMWNTYYYLKEALKYQRPKVILLEAYTTTFEDEYSGASRIIKNTFGMKWSKNKIDAIRISVPEEQFKNYLLSYSQYHSRYKELSKADFLENQGNNRFINWKGFGCNMAVVSQKQRDISNVTERIDLFSKTEEYFRKVIELAKENNIPICIVVSPYPEITEKDQMVFNRAEDIAEEYNVPFINYNLMYEGLQLDFSCDFADDGHLNYRGNPKYTRAIGEYLIKKYKLTDHRGEDEYASWEKDAEYIRASVENQKLSEASKAEELMSLLKSPQYTIILYTTGEFTTGDIRLKALFECLGISEPDECGIWMCREGEKAEKLTEEIDFENHYEWDEHDVIVSHKGENNNVIFDGVICQKTYYGVDVLVYSDIIGNIVDVFGIDADNGYCIVR